MQDENEFDVEVHGNKNQLRITIPKTTVKLTNIGEDDIVHIHLKVIKREERKKDKKK